MKKKLSKKELRRKEEKKSLKPVRDFMKWIKKEERKIARANSSRKLHKAWALKVKERDNWTCQVCKKCYINEKKKLQAAHLVSKENYPEIRYDTNIGISLCFSCHNTGKISSHLDGFVFTLWLKKNKPEQYAYVENYLKSKLYI